MHRYTYLCAQDRQVRRAGYNSTHCPVCRQPMQCMGYKWRAPKKRDERAWRRVQAGEVLWDRKSTAVVQERMTPSLLTGTGSKP